MLVYIICIRTACPPLIFTSRTRGPRTLTQLVQCDISKYKNNIRDVCSTADLVLVLLVHLVHWYLVHGLIGTSGALVPGTLVPNVT